MIDLIETIIRLSGGMRNDPNSPAQQLINRVNDATKDHPFDPYARLHGMVSLSISPSVNDRNNSVHIGDIRSLDPHKGHASETMRQLCADADELGVDLELVAKAYGGDGMSTTRLKSWYEGFGFRQEPNTFGDEIDGWDMIRKAH